MAAISCLGVAPATAAAPAPANGVEGTSIGASNWESSMSGVRVGFDSRRWQDRSYSEVRFSGCDIPELSGSSHSVHVDLRWDRSLGPDKSWGVKKATACFNGKVSAGEWTGLSLGQHFFQIDRIIGSKNCLCSLNVKKVYVDTTKADG